MDWALESPEGNKQSPGGDSQTLQGERQWDDLPKWLRSGEGIYWVSGKAGSGKSTLMKRLVQHSRTGDLLLEWASSRGRSYNLIKFFFSCHGTPEQQSQSGLSRSLLHQILSRHPEAIPDSLPGMWKELRQSVEGKRVGLPPLAETRHAFQVLASKSAELGAFCFFIDSLDEFAGSFWDAIAFIKDLTANPGFKVVVSSRPISECIAGFEDYPKLRLQDLTRQDIANYVHDTITGHKYMKRLTNRYPTQAQRLINDIVDKSSGVFLWVVLACRSLLSGFAGHDQLADLERRVEELPPELGEMFKRMLSKIDKRRREQGAFMLRVCHTIDSARRNDFLIRDSVLAIGLKSLGLAMIASVGNGQHDGTHDQLLSFVQRRERCEEFEGWLTSRCGGLLELRQHGLGDCFCQGEGII